MSFFLKDCLKGIIHIFCNFSQTIRHHKLQYSHHSTDSFCLPGKLYIPYKLEPYSLVFESIFKLP